MSWISRGPVSSVGSLCLRSKLFHQQVLISQFPLHNHCQLSQPRDEKHHGDMSTISDSKGSPLPKYVYNFYLPMGAKKYSFSERRSMVKNRRQSLKLSQGESKSNTRNPLSTTESTLQLCNTLEPNQLKNDKKENPKKPKLDLVSYILTNDLTNIFMQRQDWSLYRRDLVFQYKDIDIAGLEKYMLFVNLLRMLAHARFVYVRMTLLSVTLDEEEGSVQVRWSIIGLGMLEFCLRYFPDKLWEKNSMERLSPSYLDGYSTFYVDGDNKIYRHTVEEVRRGRDKEKVPSMIERIAAIVNRQPVSQQPALMKGPM